MKKSITLGICMFLLVMSSVFAFTNTTETQNTVTVIDPNATPEVTGGGGGTPFIPLRYEVFPKEIERTGTILPGDEIEIQPIIIENLFHETQTITAEFSCEGITQNCAADFCTGRINEEIIVEEESFLTLNCDIPEGTIAGTEYQLKVLFFNENELQRTSTLSIKIPEQDVINAEENRRDSQQRNRQIALLVGGIATVMFLSRKINVGGKKRRR